MAANATQLDLTGVGATWTLLTPTTHPGAVGMIQISAASGDAMDRVFVAVGMAGVGVGDVRLRDLLHIDTGLVARVDDCTLLLMPHGSPAGVRRLVAELSGIGILQAAREIGEQGGSALSGRLCHARALFPEARGEVEARALLALARAPSSLAVDLLLAQHDLWQLPGASSDLRRDAVLMRLLVPAVVVAVGPSNIGKSTLLNALAKRHVSIVADEPGTTRDHVGVLLDLGGLVVQYIDTPGIRETDDAEELAARAAAIGLAERADVLIACGDHDLPPGVGVGTEARRHVGTECLKVALRVDRGEPTWACDVAVSAATGRGLEELVGRLREVLVPESVLKRNVPWKFW